MGIPVGFWFWDQTVPMGDPSASRYSIHHLAEYLQKRKLSYRILNACLGLASARLDSNTDPFCRGLAKVDGVPVSPRARSAAKSISPPQPPHSSQLHSPAQPANVYFI